MTFFNEPGPALPYGQTGHLPSTFSRKGGAKMVSARNASDDLFYEDSLTFYQKLKKGLKTKVYPVSKKS
jgi:hypothetical protein